MRDAGFGKGTGSTETLEAVMAGVVAAMAIVFLAGLAVGALAALAVLARREDRSHALTGDILDRLVTGTRRLGGVGRREPGRRLLP